MGKQNNIYITKPDHERLTKLIEIAREREVPSGVRRLRVEEVLYQPESKGEYHL